MCPVFLLCLSFFFFQKREIFDELAPLLWHSVGTTAAFLQVDLVSSYLQSK